MKLLITLLCALSFAVSTQAQILQASQLFNTSTTKVKQESFAQSRSFYAKTALDETSMVDIVTRFDGYITELYANEKMMSVQKGKALFSIYSDDILSLQEELKIAKKINQNIYTSTLEKLNNLDISSKEIAKIKKDKITAKGIQIRSPINGIVLQKNINHSSAIKKGQLLLQLASLDKTWVIASIYQSDLGYVQKGMSAEVYLDGVAKPIYSVVDFIYPIFDDKSKTVSVRVVLDNANALLRPNMFAKVNLTKPQKTILTLPKTAVIQKANDYYAFRPTEDGNFEPVKITAKRISSTKYEIIEGLEMGESVINNALFMLDSDAVTNGLYDDASEDEDW